MGLNISEGAGLDSTSPKPILTTSFFQQPQIATPFESTIKPKRINNLKLLLTTVYTYDILCVSLILFRITPSCNSNRFCILHTLSFTSQSIKIK